MWLIPPGALASQYILHLLAIFGRRKEKVILPLECYLKPKVLRKQCMINESFWKHPKFHGESELSSSPSKEYNYILIWINELNPMVALVASRWLGKINSKVFYTEKKYPFISEPMTSHAKLTFFKSLIRDTCREGLKYPEIFIPLSYLNLYSWLVCPAKSVFSVVYVLVDCLATVCLSPFSFLSEHSPCLHQVFTSAFPRGFCTVLLSLVFLSWTNTCITWLASQKAASSP